MSKVVDPQWLFFPSSSPSLLSKMPKQLPFALAIVTAIGFILASILIWQRFPLLKAVDDMWGWASLSCGGGSAFLALIAKIFSSYCQPRTAKLALQPDIPPKTTKPKSITPRPIKVAEDSSLEQTEPPPVKHKKKKPSPPPPQTPAGHGSPDAPVERKAPPSTLTSSSDQLPERTPKLSDDERAKRREANLAIKKVDEFLASYKTSRGSLSLEEVNRLRDEWERWAKNKPFIYEPPPKGAKETDPRVKLDQKVQILKTIQDHYDFYHCGFDRNGLLETKENGDCLFESFVVQSYLHGSYMENATQSIQDEREETVRWIYQNFATDKKLQEALTESMDDHYAAKKKKIADELSSLQTGLLLEEDEPTQLLTSKNYSALETKKFETEAKTQFLGSTWHNFTKEHAALLPEYLNEMLIGGTFGSSAELYALCKRHNVYAEIYYRNGNDGTIVKNVDACFNKEALQGGSPKEVRSFLQENKHYRPYFPSSK